MGMLMNVDYCQDDMDILPESITPEEDTEYRDFAYSSTSMASSWAFAGVEMLFGVVLV